MPTPRPASVLFKTTEHQPHSESVLPVPLVDIPSKFSLQRCVKTVSGTCAIWCSKMVIFSPVLLLALKNPPTVKLVSFAITVLVIDAIATRVCSLVLRLFCSSQHNLETQLSVIDFFLYVSHYFNTNNRNLIFKKCLRKRNMTHSRKRLTLVEIIELTLLLTVNLYFIGYFDFG